MPRYIIGSDSESSGVHKYDLYIIRWMASTENTQRTYLCVHWDARAHVHRPFVANCASAIERCGVAGRGWVF